MISALFYLQYHSTKNRFVSRLKRLKQPKYLAGAVVGLLYFYFYFFRFLFHAPRHNGAAAATVSPGNFLLDESVRALILLVVVLAAWLWPNKRAALTFTEA